MTTSPAIVSALLVAGIGYQIEYRFAQKVMMRGFDLDAWTTNNIPQERTRPVIDLVRQIVTQFTTRLG